MLNLSVVFNFQSNFNIRVVRLVTSSIFFLMCILRFNKHLNAKTLAIFLIVFGDLIALFYDYKHIDLVVMVLRAMHSIVFLVYVIPVFKDVIKDKKQLSLFLILAIIDIYFYSILIRSEMYLVVSAFHEVLMYIHLVIAVLLIMTSSSYCFGHATKASYVLMLFVFVILISDFLGLMGFYIGRPELHILGQPLYVLALAAYTYFLLIPEDEYLAQF